MHTVNASMQTWLQAPPSDVYRISHWFTNVTHDMTQMKWWMKWDHLVPQPHNTITEPSAPPLSMISHWNLFWTTAIRVVPFQIRVGTCFVLRCLTKSKNMFTDVSLGTELGEDKLLCCSMYTPPVEHTLLWHAFLFLLNSRQPMFCSSLPRTSYYSLRGTAFH